jgi:hypothetical protein
MPPTVDSFAWQILFRLSIVRQSTDFITTTCQRAYEFSGPTVIHFRYNLVLVSALSCFTLSAYALEIETRLWSHLPLGVNVAGVGYAHTEVDVALDPAILLQDVHADLDIVAGKYVRSFELFGKSARIDLGQAYISGQWTGLLNGAHGSTSRDGWSDSFARFAINLYGAPPLSGKEYGDYRSGKQVETIVGAALAFRLPTGEYNEKRLINLSENRFTFRPQLGLLHRRGKWSAELTSQIEFYTDNNEFFNGNKLEQDPIYTVFGSLVYTFRPGLSIAGAAGYNYGGEYTSNGIDNNDTKQSLGWAISLAYPINRRAGFSIKYLGTRAQEAVGSDSDTVAAGFSYLW